MTLLAAAADSDQPELQHNSGRWTVDGGRLRFFPIFLALALCLMLASHAFAVEPAEMGGSGVSGLPIPRFVSLKSDKVHLRVGPGKDYPIDWVYVKRGLPVEIVAEYDVWRKIRDYQGTEGWVHQQRLTGRRMIMTTSNVQPLLRRSEDNAPVLAQIEAGVVGRLLECNPVWCRIEVGGFRGWVKRGGLWGIYPSEQKIEG